ncbi:FliH/SctL family protein [Acidaminobacterium chupaoyuni]
MPKVIKNGSQLHLGKTVRIPDAKLAAEAGPPEEQEEKFIGTQPPCEETKTIIREIYCEPEPLSREELEAEYETELRQIRDSAAQVAYEQAFCEKAREIDACIAEIDRSLSALSARTEAFFQEAADGLTLLAVETAEKILLQKIKEDDTVLLPLVMGAVNQVKDAPWLKVELPECAAALAEKVRKELQRPEYCNRGQVVFVPGDAGICRIKTSGGALVADVGTQLENLRDTISNAENRLNGE